jgi:hypothetical protein
MTHSSVVLSWTTASSRASSNAWLLIQKLASRGRGGNVPFWKVKRRCAVMSAVERSSTGSNVVGSRSGVIGLPLTTSVARLASFWVVNPVEMGRVRNA